MKFMNSTANESINHGYMVACDQLQGLRPTQEDSISIFNNECIAVADGVGALPHGELASTVVCETAIWGYTHVRQRPYYWEEKTKLLARIFRTSNLALWQKRKEPGLTDGLASTLCVVILGVKKIWIGTVGDSRVYLIREGLIEEMVPPETQSEMQVPMALGFERSGIVPRITAEAIISGDILVVATDGVCDLVTEEDLRAASELVNSSDASCMNAVSFLLTQAQERGSHDNMSVCIIKKI